MWKEIIAEIENNIFWFARKTIIFDFFPGLQYICFPNLIKNNNNKKKQLFFYIFMYDVHNVCKTNEEILGVSGCFTFKVMALALTRVWTR